MVSTSARNAGGPWFDSRSRHDRFLYANSVYLCNFLYRAVLCFLYIYIYNIYKRVWGAEAVEEGYLGI